MTSIDPPWPPAGEHAPVPASGIPAAERLAGGSVRRLGQPIATVRSTLLPIVRQLEFAITTEQFSLIEAERGSKLGGLTLSAGRVPVALRIDLDRDGDGTLLAVRLEDRWKIPLARNWGAVNVYTELFTSVLTAIDTALGRLDPAAAAAFEPWWAQLGSGDVASMQNAASLAARAEKVFHRRAGRLLDGPQDPRNRSAMESAGLTMLTFNTADKSAQFSADDVDGILTAGQLVSGRPDNLPANLVDDVQHFVVTLEEQLERAKVHGAYGSNRLMVSDAQVPVLTFLYQQAKLREQLPMRVLMVCTTCRLEKIVNPDFTRLRERNRRSKVLSSSVGAVFGSHQISPYILLGRLVQLKNTDPDFVCQRCQGLDADQTMVTFCPQCGERRGETVLRNCQKCDFDFRGLVKTKPSWHELESAPSAPAWPAPDDSAPHQHYPTVIEADPVPGPAVHAPIANAPIVSTPIVGPPRGALEVAAAWNTPSHWAASETPAGWHADPLHRYEMRYWDGSRWTEHVSTEGAVGVDSI